MPLMKAPGVDVISEGDHNNEFWRILARWAGLTIVITGFLLGRLTTEVELVTGFDAAVLSMVLVGTGFAVWAHGWISLALSSAFVAGDIHYVLDESAGDWVTHRRDTPVQPH